MSSKLPKTNFVTQNCRIKLGMSDFSSEKFVNLEKEIAKFLYQGKVKFG